MIQPRILARVSRNEFVGRDDELRSIVRHGSPVSEARGMLLLAEPGAGGSELLRQAYDQLFMRRGEPVPIYFAFERGEVATFELARRFFLTILQQYIAYRRLDASLCRARLTINELLELAPPGDYELISKLVEAFQREKTEETDFIDFCFGLPRRLMAEGRPTYPMIDCLAVRPLKEEMTVAGRLVSAVEQAGGPFVFLGLRRQLVDLISPEASAGVVDRLHIENLKDDYARRVVEVLSDRHRVPTNEPTRDLIVQQLNGSPFFITTLMYAAREARTSLTTFLDCQRLYVDEVLGGGIKRHFDRILEVVSQNPQTRKTLLRVLFEAASGEARKSSLWTWKKRLGADATEFEHVIEALHVAELVNSSAAFIEVNTALPVWMDYLRAHYHLEVAGESRARVVGAMLFETLKRAPQTMARKYRREASLGLSELISQFNCQSVPSTLFHYDRFAAAYRGEETDVVERGLDAESDLIRLPQVVQATAASAYSPALASDSERSVVAHAFEAADYTDENEVVWLAAQIDSKLEASRELAEEWCQRLSALARECGFKRTRIWLVAPEGFSKQASKLLKQLDAFGSSRQQVELLASRIMAEPRETTSAHLDEYEMVIPMGADTEVIAAQTVEQIARRINFRPEAINQIKTALVEACINATEHSLSPDRKIYQRFVVEGDRLVVTVASRGVVPAQLAGQNGQSGNGDQENGKGRRGWGLKLIKTLMDEVEFQRVDDGTQLRMTKYLR